MDAVCEAAEWASRDLGNVPVIVFSSSGDSALYLAKLRNQSRILAFTPEPRVADMLSLAWNVTPFVLAVTRDQTLLEKKAEDILIRRKVVRKGELVVIVCGTNIARGSTNYLKVKKVGEE